MSGGQAWSVGGRRFFLEEEVNKVKMSLVTTSVAVMTKPVFNSLLSESNSICQKRVDSDRDWLRLIRD